MLLNNVITGKTIKLHIILFTVIFISTFLICSQIDLTGKLKFTAYRSMSVITNFEGNITQNSSMKYILLWTKPNRDPIMNLEVENRAFIKKKCSNTNCYVTSDRNFFGDVSQFDVIVFHGPDINGPDIILKDLPNVRSKHQKYVFASMESAYNYPICNNMFNDYFNWTWTYRLDSDEEYGYISIWNKSGEIIGPKVIMHWMKFEEMKPIDENFKKKLSAKKKAAAWFVSHCHTPSKREDVAKRLQIELQKHNLTLDIYGACSQKKCPRKESEKCLTILETDYYFYLAFENSFCTDYVTEKLLHALQNYAVPVVYGGANYTRFMPDGIYLDASKLTITELVNKMVELINDKEKYYNYFKWHNHYSYHDALESPLSDGYCKLCSMINNQNFFNKASIYNDFIQWWSPHEKCINNKLGI